MSIPNPPFNTFPPTALPPRPQQPTTNTAPDKTGVALFIDWDNLVISNYADSGNQRPDLDILVRKSQEYGTLLVARAYGEWSVTADRLAVFNAGIDPSYAPVFHNSTDLSGQTTRGKSLADPVMVTDCIDLLHTMPSIGTYILVTGDKDMVPVVRLAKLRGRKVIIIGPDFVANVLQQVSNEFYSYRQLQVQQFVQQYGYYPGYVPQQPQVAGQPTLQPQQPSYTPQQPQVAGYVQQQPQIVSQPMMPQPQPPQPQQSQQPNLRGGNQRRVGNVRGGRNQPYTPPAQPYAQIQMPQPQQPGTPQFYGQPQQYNTYVQPQPTPQPGYVQPSYPQPQTGYVQPQPLDSAPTDVPVGAPGMAAPQTIPTQPQTLPLISVQQPTPVAQPAAQPAPAAPVTAEKAAQLDLQQVKDALQWILAARASQGKLQVRARDLKEELLRKLPAFAERKLGFAKFKSLLNAVEQVGVIQLEQVEHILWVSLPGAPSTPEPEQIAAAEPDVDDDETDETAQGGAQPAQVIENRAESRGRETVSTPVAVEIQETLPTFGSPATTPALAQETAATLPAYPLHISSVTGGVDEAASLASAVSTPAADTASVPTNVSETAAPVKEAEALADPVIVNTGPRPALLDVPYIEDTIRLVDNLRSRNRWLGYDLLIASTRDMLLTRDMPESDAKLKARDLVSRLLDESVLRIEQEMRSRGASRQKVKVCYLQEENPVAHYVLTEIAIEKGEAVRNVESVPTVLQEVEAAVSVSEAPIQDVPAEVTPVLQVAVDAEDRSPVLSDMLEHPETLPTAEATPVTEAPQQQVDVAAPVTEAEFARPEATSTEPVVRDVEAWGHVPSDTVEHQETPPTAEAAPVAEQVEQHAEVAPVAETSADFLTAFYNTPRVISLDELAAAPLSPNHVADIAQEVAPPVIVPDGLAPDTGDGVQGAPDPTVSGEPAPSGGYLDTGMDTQPQAMVDGSQPDAVAVIDSEFGTIESDLSATLLASIDATSFVTNPQTDPSDVLVVADDAPDAVVADGEGVVAPKRRAPYRRRPRPAAARSETGDAPEGGNSGSNSPSMRLGYRFRQHHRTDSRHTDSF